MGILFLFLGIILIVICIIYSASTEKIDIYSLLFLILAVFFIFVPFIKNDEVVLKEHVSFKTDLYKGIKYNIVVKVEYDLVSPKYWWTYSFVHGDYIKNETIIFEE